MTIQLTVSGMSCGGCAASLQKPCWPSQPSAKPASIRQPPGRHRERLSREELIALIEARGFTAE